MAGKGFRYRRMRPDVASDLKMLLENCLYASEIDQGEINEHYATLRLVRMLDDDYPEHRKAVLNRDVLYEICADAVENHINRTKDAVYLRDDLASDVPEDLRDRFYRAGSVRRYFRVKDKIRGGFHVVRREKMDEEDWEQIREQRHQTARENQRQGDHADTMIRLGRALEIEGAIGEQVFALAEAPVG